MAILGFLVHTLPEEAAQVERAVQGIPEITTYGVHQDCYLVAVAEAATDRMESLLEQVRKIDGVLTCYVTSMSTQDEEDE